MPYNFEPIPPADEVNGSTALPLARVKRIIKLDEEIGACSSSAAFLVTVAAEMFIQYLAKQGYKGAQKDRRKNLQYKDLANAVAALDTLEFLSDTIPRTVPYKKVAGERIRKASTGDDDDGGGGIGDEDIDVTGEGKMFNGGSRLPRLGHNTNTLSPSTAAMEMAPEEVDDEDYSGSREESMDVESAVTNGRAYHNGSSHRRGSMDRGDEEREREQERERERERDWEGQGSGDYDEDMC